MSLGTFSFLVYRFIFVFVFLLLSPFMLPFLLFSRVLSFQIIILILTSFRLSHLSFHTLRFSPLHSFLLFSCVSCLRLGLFHYLPSPSSVILLSSLSPSLVFLRLLSYLCSSSSPLFFPLVLRSIKHPFSLPSLCILSRLPFHRLYLSLPLPLFQSSLLWAWHNLYFLICLVPFTLFPFCVKITLFLPQRFRPFFFNLPLSLPPSPSLLHSPQVALSLILSLFPSPASHQCH